MSGWSDRRRRTFGYSILRLIGHLACTAGLFICLFAIGWAVSFILNYLHSVHPFPEPIHRLVTRSELVLVYIDITISSIVLLAGVLRYVRDVWENE